MKKILAFIKDEEDKFLLLKGSENDPQFHESFWYTVTGSVEDIDVDLIDTVKREVKEETNIEAFEIKYLNLILEYKSLGVNCKEYVYICNIKSNNDIILNEEHTEYKWCDLEEFVDNIKWYYSKQDLALLLANALVDNKLYDEEKIITIN